MYARDVNRRTITLGVSGMLWNRSLVMYDPETYTYWSHFLGRAMSGPLEGAELRQIASVMTDWGSWKSRHPQTTVLWLPRSSRAYSRAFYRSPKEFVLGMADHQNPRAWSFDRLLEQPIINDTVADRSVVVTFDPESKTARLFSRQVQGRPMNFELDARGFIDRQSRSLWDRVTGQCIDGHYKGQQLEPMLAIVSYRKTWMAFHPKTEIK